MCEAGRWCYRPRPVERPVLTVHTKTWRDAAKLSSLKVIDGLQAMGISAWRRLLFRRLRLPGNETSIRSILVLRIGTVGDFVVALPALAAIRKRFPDSRITLLTSAGAPGAPGAQDLIRPGHLVDSLIVYHRTEMTTWAARKRLVRRIRGERFDLFVEIPNTLAGFRHAMESMVLARLSGCRYGAGFEAAACRLFPRTQSLYRPFQRESDRIFDSLANDLDLKRTDTGRLAVSEADRSFVRELLKRNGLTGRAIIVMHVGAKRPANRWFEDRFAEVADAVQERHDIRVLLTGAESELERVNQVRARMKTEPVVLCGELQLLQLAALLEQACLYVGNDTGPMHIAAAMGTPTVAIFSARDFPVQWFPNGTGHVVLRNDVPCSPCFKDVCDRGLTCLDMIQADDVLRAIDVQLKGRTPGLTVLSEAKHSSLPITS
jgi:heptosyltransferase-1